MKSYNVRPRQVAADIDETVTPIDHPTFQQDELHLESDGHIGRLPTYTSSTLEPDAEDFELGVSVEEWMEIQLLDCQNLARQNGYASLAALLDSALDQLARDVSEHDSSTNDRAKGLVLSFPTR